MELTIKAVTSNLVNDVSKLFSCDVVANACSCMWFIIPVKQFHAAGEQGNRASFGELAAKSELPVGLLAYQNDEPVGWCAVGPRSRYVRALQTPTYKGGEPLKEPDNVWLVPCFFIRKDVRRAGVAQALLEEAVTLASANGATAIEGFPLYGVKRRSGGDAQVGHEALFSSCGFDVIRTPSTSRVVMRRELTTF